MKRVHLPVVHRSVSQRVIFDFSMSSKVCGINYTVIFLFSVFCFFFSKVECKKERVDWTAWSARWDLFGVSTRDVDKRERFESLSLHKVRPIEAMMMMLMTIKTCRMVRKLQVSKVDRNVERERERCMHDHWCVIISFWVICPVKNRCKSTYLLFDVLKALCESLWCPYL